MKVTIDMKGEKGTHVTLNGSTDATLCGIHYGGAEELKQVSEAKKDSFITCPACTAIILDCRAYTFRDFDMMAFMDDMKRDRTPWPAAHLQETFPEITDRQAQKIFQEWFDKEAALS